jgi:hypothetical protein
MVLRSILSYTAASRSVGGGVRAFEDATKFLVGNMLRSMARKLEIELLYGQVGIGIVASVTGLTIFIQTSEWAPGIWAGSENMIIDTHVANTATSRGLSTIQSVDFTGQSITVDNVFAIATGDYIYINGSYGNEFAGLQAIMTNTGTLFNISAAQYTLWAGNTYSSGLAALSFTKVNNAIARAVEKGLDSEVVVLVNPRTWSDLLSDQAALRRYDGSYKDEEFEQGAKSIKFYGQNGMIEICPSIYIKQGYAFILPMDDLIRVGSSDITFKRPGQGEEFFRDLETAAGYELRAYCDQAVFSAAPGRMVLVNNIVNGS